MSKLPPPTLTTWLTVFLLSTILSLLSLPSPANLVYPSLPGLPSFDLAESSGAVPPPGYSRYDGRLPPMAPQRSAEIVLHLAYHDYDPTMEGSASVHALVFVDGSELFLYYTTVPPNHADPLGLDPFDDAVTDYVGHYYLALWNDNLWNVPSWLLPKLGLPDPACPGEGASLAAHIGAKHGHKTALAEGGAVMVAGLTTTETGTAITGFSLASLLCPADGELTGLFGVPTGTVVTTAGVLTAAHGASITGFAASNLMKMADEGGGWGDKPGTPKTPHVPSGPMKGRRIGHTFAKHGSHNTDELIRQARGSGMPQGQWLDDAAAEQFIADHLDDLANGAKTFDLPEGLGRQIMPDGSSVPATRVRLVPSKTGVKTAYPTN